MARIGFRFLILLSLLFAPSLWAQAGVSPGIVTANNVDITTDTGEVLPERLNVGDSIYVVDDPGKVRKGWVRVSRSPDDNIGIGWVEEKNIRTYKRWSTSSAPAPQPQEMKDPGDELLDLALDDELPTEGSTISGQKKVAVLNFSGSNPGEAFLADARKYFISNLRQSGGFDFQGNVTGKGINPDSESSVKGLLSQHSLDGVFVGSVSPPIGGARLVKVKYFSKHEGTFSTEKVKRVSSEANLSAAMSELVKSCVDEIAAF